MRTDHEIEHQMKHVLVKDSVFFCSFLMIFETGKRTGDHYDFSNTNLRFCKNMTPP